MSIFVKYSNEEKFSITIDGKDTIYSIKERIEKEKGIPIEKQKILKAGKVFDDDEQTIVSAGIVNNSLIHVFCNDTFMFNYMNIRFAAAEPFEIKYKKEKDSIIEIKQIIEKLKGYPIKRQKLFDGEVELEDNKLPKDYKISKFSCLQLDLEDD